MRCCYLASPFTPVGEHSAEDGARLRRERYVAVCRAAAALMRRGEVVFSPIAHSFGIDEHFNAPESGEFWKRQDEPYLMACDRMIVLCLPDWGLSAGVAHEIAVAAQRGIPIEYMGMEDLGVA
jgi:hypothetical protein